MVMSYEYTFWGKLQTYIMVYIHGGHNLLFYKHKALVFHKCDIPVKRYPVHYVAVKVDLEEIQHVSGG